MNTTRMGNIGEKIECFTEQDALGEVNIWMLPFFKPAHVNGMLGESFSSYGEAAKALLEKGVQRVFLSMGSDGMYAATADTQLWMDNIPGSMVNTTGCGDAAMAALVWAWMNDLSLKETVQAGLAAGAIAMESSETINPAMSVTALKLRMSE